MRLYVVFHVHMSVCGCFLYVYSNICIYNINICMCTSEWVIPYRSRYVGGNELANLKYSCWWLLESKLEVFVITVHCLVVWLGICIRYECVERLHHLLFLFNAVRLAFANALHQLTILNYWKTFFESVQYILHRDYAECYGIINV